MAQNGVEQTRLATMQKENIENMTCGRALQPSRQNILQTCAKLEKLGAKQSERNPLPQLIEEK